jgi:hypothetical protein
VISAKIKDGAYELLPMASLTCRLPQLVIVGERWCLVCHPRRRKKPNNFIAVYALIGDPEKPFKSKDPGFPLLQE